MRKVHVIFTKEQLLEKTSSQNCAIVLDIIFATTSINAALESNVNKVIPALNIDDAKQITESMSHKDWIIAGEYNAIQLHGYWSFDPLAMLDETLQNKDLIYSTTNGTVALRKASYFDKVYAACLRNGKAVINHMLKTSNNQDIFLICSGSAGQFNLEDFYGAGYLVHCLNQRLSSSEIEYTDAAMAAKNLYNSMTPLDAISSCYTGRKMKKLGLKDNLIYAAQTGVSNIVPMYNSGFIKNVFLT